MYSYKNLEIFSGCSVCQLFLSGYRSTLHGFHFLVETKNKIKPAKYYFEFHQSKFEVNKGALFFRFSFPLPTQGEQKTRRKENTKAVHSAQCKK